MSSVGELDEQSRVGTGPGAFAQHRRDAGLDVLRGSLTPVPDEARLRVEESDRAGARQQPRNELGMSLEDVVVELRTGGP